MRAQDSISHRKVRKGRKVFMRCNKFVPNYNHRYYPKKLSYTLSRDAGRAVPSGMQMEAEGGAWEGNSHYNLIEDYA